MATHYYRALLEPDGKGGYGIVFPDVPGCVSAGADAESAVRNAAEALAFHLEGMAEDGALPPEPSPPDAPLPDWLDEMPDAGRLMRVLVPVTVSGKARRINITLEESLLARLDSAARNRRMSRSAFLAEAVRHALAGA